MSYGPTMAVGRRGSWRVEVEEDGGSRAPGVAVAFVPPPRGARESLSSCEDGSLGVYSDEDEEDLPYPGFLALTWGCLFQNTVPRNYCLAMLTNPYPFLRQRAFRDLTSPCSPMQWRSVVRTKASQPSSPSPSITIGMHANAIATTVSVPEVPSSPLGCHQRNVLPSSPKGE